MNLSNPWRRGATLATLLLLLSSCANEAPSVRAPVAASEDSGWAQAAADVRVLTIDPRESSVRIHVFRAGKAAKLGHNHVLSAPQFTGRLELPAGGALAAARFQLDFRLDQLEIDRPELRAALGPAYASFVSEAAIAGTREHMLGRDNLQADEFPEVRVRSVRVVGEAPSIAAQVRVTLHGASRDLWVPLTVNGLPERLSVTGSFVLRQSDFGVRPYSVLAGMLAVEDEVVIVFTMVGA